MRRDCGLDRTRDFLAAIPEGDRRSGDVLIRFDDEREVEDVAPSCDG